MQKHTFKHRQEYFDLNAFSRSDIVAFLKGPNHYRAYVDNKDKREPSENMEYGTALHEYVLNHDKFDSMYSIKPDSMKLSTKEGIAFKNNAAEAGRLIIPESWGFHIKQQYEALMRHNTARGIIEGAIYEPAVSWQDLDSGLNCKSMPDIFNQEKNLIADLKTMANYKFHDRGMVYSIKDFGYDIQGAMAADAFGLESFVLIFVSTDFKNPWKAVDVACRQIHPEDIQRARMCYRQCLKELKVCIDTNSWPSKWSDDIIPIAASIVETEMQMEGEDF
jgi:hypothetical protein